MITLHTINELTNFLENNELPTLVGAVRFDGDLLRHVLDSGYHQIGIDDEIGFFDDGGWIEIDDNGNVVEDMYLP